MKIDLVDLKVQYASIKSEIDSAIQSVIENSAFTLGQNVEEFERNFAQYCKVKYCVGVNSGTDALQFALFASGVKHGDEVILPVNTFIATAEAISHCGAIPVFVDMDEKTYNIDVLKIEEKITPKTKAIMPVHLYGQPANMDAVLIIARKYGLKVIEDACQAHGAEILMGNGKWERAGEIGDVGCFSFYPGKNLGAYGDGGAMVTNNQQVYQTVKLMRSHGENSKYTHSIIGYCSRLHGIQAAILNVKLKRLDEWNQKRIEHALLYSELLCDLDVILPYAVDSVKHVYHLYIIRVNDRDNLMKFLTSHGIYTGIHYPIPIHLQSAYKELGYKEGDFPVAEKVSREIVSLPMYPELTREQIEYVADSIKNYYKRG